MDKVYAPGSDHMPETGIRADSFEELAEKAIQMVDGASGFSMVCGPITTGGAGHKMLNLEIFNATIAGLQNRKVRLFDQTPFEFGLMHLTNEWEANGGKGYCMPILEVFYETLFRRGIIVEGYFIPGWKSSFGATWEHNWLDQHGIVRHLSRKEIGEFMLAKFEKAHVDSIMPLVADDCFLN